jgi:signal transduction histidine kinase
MTIKRRLLLFFAIVALSAGAATFALIRGATEAEFRSFVFSGDAEKAGIYAGILGDYYAGRAGWEGLQEFLSDMPTFVHSEPDDRVGGGQAAAGAGRPASALRALPADRIAVADSGGRIVADNSGKLIGTVHPAGHLSLGIPVVSGGRRVGTVLVGSMIDSTFTGEDERFLDRVMRSTAFAVLASMALAVLLGLALSGRITRPLAILERAAGRIAGGDFSAAVPVSGRDEISSLSASFNVMAAELRRLDDAKRRIIADSAHELRTPVTLVRGNLEAMLDGVFPVDEAGLRGVYDETMRLSRLIDMLRELELIDSGGMRLDISRVELGPALEKAASLFKSQAEDKDIALSLDLPAPAPAVMADALRLDEVLYNLIGNAIKYAPRRGSVSVSARGGEDAATIRVDDSGPGISEAERDKVFERFYRTDKSRAQDSGGRGLGLSIAQEIVMAHGGSIRVEGSALGGSSFIVTLPSAEEAEG